MKTKSLSTPFKIIKILKLMTEKPVSIDEILISLENEGIFVNKETISKYFTTLREAGCNIEKRKNKFYIKYPILELNEAELNTLARFQGFVKSVFSKKDHSIFLKFLDKVFTLIDMEEVREYLKIRSDLKVDYGNIDNKSREMIENISKFMNENGQKIKITYREGKESRVYNIIPLRFDYKKAPGCKVSLLAYDNGQNVNKTFLLNNIEDILPTPIKAVGAGFGLSTTFKITGKLKNTYTPRKDEIVTYYDDYIVVVNKNEDKTELLRRLLKYGVCAEVLYPKADREAFLNLVNGLIEKCGL